MNETPESAFSNYLKIITKRWWLFILLPVVTTAAILIINAVSEPEYVAYERLQIIPNDTLVVPLFSRTPVLTTAQQLQSVHDDFYDVIRSSSVAWKTIADLNLDMSAEELIRRIDTQHVSEFITVSARMPSPELAKEVVTVHTQNAIDAFRTIRVNPAQSTLEFLDEQVEAQGKALAAAREALQKFQLEHEVSSLPDEIAAEQDFQRRLTAERDRLRTEAARAKALAASFQQQADENRKQARELSAVRVSIQPPTPAAAAPITGTQSVTATTTVTPTVTPTPAPTATPNALTPEMAQKKREALLTLAAEQETKAQEQLAIAAGHEAAIADYDRLLDEREQQIVFLLGLQDQYAALVNELDAAQGSYDFLVDKTNEARLKVAQGSQGYLEVVTPARQPNAPTPRHTLQIVFIGILASLLVGLLLAFLLEIIERSVR